MFELELRIAHIYPKLLNIYGDSGNILTLKKRSNDRNIKTVVTEIAQGDYIDFSNHDFFFIGGGQDQEQIKVSSELLLQKDDFSQAASHGKVFLGICGGYQLLGNYYQFLNGEKLCGLELLDIITIAGEKRLTGNVYAELSAQFQKGESLVGFENHSGQTFLSGSTKPLAKVIRGFGNNKKDKTEGAYHNSVFGTYLHGPVLPKNPAFADHLIKLALQNRYQDEITLQPLDDSLENAVHDDLSKLR